MTPTPFPTKTVVPLARAAASRSCRPMSEWLDLIRKFSARTGNPTNFCYPVIQRDGSVRKWFVRDTGWYDNEGNYLS